MKNRVLFASVAACALCCIGAYADGAAAPAASPEKAMASSPHWEGFYAGLAGGYDWGLVHVTDLDSYNGPPQLRYEPDGGSFRVYGGYGEMVYENILVGLELEVGYFGLGGSQQYPPYVGVRSATDSVASIDGGFLLSGTVRVGYAIDDFLVYAKVGGAGVDLKASYIDSDTTGTTLVSGTSAGGVRGGLTFGAGIEYWIMDRWTIRVEYDRYDLGAVSQIATSAGSQQWRFRHTVLSNSVKAGFAYYF